MDEWATVGTSSRWMEEGFTSRPLARIELLGIRLLQTVRAGVG
jgi:hypothetical protein